MTDRERDGDGPSRSRLVMWSGFRGVTGGRVVAAGAALAVWIPTAAAAGPVQEPPPAGTGGPVIEIDVDVATADVQDVEGTLEDISANVADQMAEVDEAESALEDAEADLTAAQDAVTATEERIDELTGLSDEVVTEAFIDPPSVGDIDVLATGSLSDLAMKQSLLNARAEEDAEVLNELADARDELEEQKGEEEDLAADASSARDVAAAELADLDAAVGQHSEFVAAVEGRLEHGQSEALALESVDPELASSLTEEQDELAGALQDIVDQQEYEEALEALAAAEEERQRREREEAERAAAEAAEAAEAAAAEEAAGSSDSGTTEDPPDLGAPSGSLATVDCPAGGSITVDSSLSSNLSSLLSAASADGIQLCGGGYRDPQEQIELRKQHCGTSQYAIYEMPSSQCSPPTARPGTSNHEQGLAIDFTCNGGGAISSQSSSCFVWLDGNAANYGLYNLPSEPWHWSVDGT